MLSIYNQQNPFRLFDELFSEAFPSLDRVFHSGNNVCSLPQSVFVKEDEKQFLVNILVPGATKENLKLKISSKGLNYSYEKSLTAAEGDTTVRTEIHNLNVENSVKFVHEVDPEKVEAKLKDGVLSITAPKLERQLPREVDVLVAE